MEPDSKPALDLPELREMYGEELLLALLREFRNSVPGMLQAVQSAVEAGDAPALFQTAHRLKSAISNLYNDGGGDAAARLERMGRFDELAEARSALPVLEREVSRLLTAVDEVLGREAEGEPPP